MSSPIFGVNTKKHLNLKSTIPVILSYSWNTLQETNISHLGKRKLIFKHALSGGYVSSLEGNPFSRNILLVRSVPVVGIFSRLETVDLLEKVEPRWSRRVLVARSLGSIPRKNCEVPTWTFQRVPVPKGCQFTIP